VGQLEDVFALQDRMAKRVTEALRMELVLAEHRAGASREAVEHYLRGRVLARDNEVTGAALEAAIGRFERARAAAPGFVLPLAAIADATVRRWFVAQPAEGERWAEASRLAVQEALRGVPGLPETHQAAARLEVNRGNFRAAALHLDAALEIAPTCAAAHEYLGMLQCDTGRSREGVQHVLFAHELDPTLGLGGVAVLRHYALHGQLDAFDALIARLRQLPSVPRFATDLFELRMALWNGLVERARSVQWPAEEGRSVLPVIEPLRMALDEGTPAVTLATRLHEACEQAANPRLRTSWRQLSVELLAWRGADGLAIETLERAEAEVALLDADWMEGCPLFSRLQDQPTFATLRKRVRERADAIWRTAPRRLQ
jgi:tetratricopeptide (TPR) repeat protein